MNSMNGKMKTGKIGNGIKRQDGFASCTKDWY